MKRLILMPFYCFLGIFANISTAQQDQEITNIIATEVVGLAIEKSDPSAPSLNNSYIPFGIPGTNLTIRLYSTQTKFYAINEPQSEILSFSDNLNTNLTDKGKKAESKWKDEHPETYVFSSLKKNGISNIQCKSEKSECVITINSTALPNPNAVKLNLQAKFVLLFEGESKETMVENIYLISGNKIDISPYSMTLQDYGSMSTGKNHYKMFKLDSEVPIHSILLYDKSGKIIDSTFDKEVLTVSTKDINNKQQINLKISYSLPKAISVPVNLSTGIGLQNNPM